ncbi:MAG TPA: hypothetical protein VJP84_08500, partial [Steroidobacteraceae bacterium]|nr:hypothetical protein [Steroidobacteraceae bacterium]
LSAIALIGLAVLVIGFRACSPENAEVQTQSHAPRSGSSSSVGSLDSPAFPAPTNALPNSSPEVKESVESVSPAAIGTVGIDWNSVRESSPIPRAMPAAQSDDPYGAGFARQWVEQSLQKRNAFFGREAGSPLMDPKPLVLDVVSEPKNPEDSWAYGAEYELRRIVDQQSRDSPEPAITRTFCNGHGCLIYMEFDGDKMADLSSIPKAILRAPWRKDFGIEARNVFVLIGRQDEPRIRWQMFLVHRHPPK